MIPPGLTGPGPFGGGPFGARRLHELGIRLPQALALGQWLAPADRHGGQRAQARLAELGFEVVEDRVSWKVYRRR